MTTLNASTLESGDAPTPLPQGGARAAALAAVDGCTFNIPLSLGAATLVFSRIGPEALAAAMVATLLALAWIHVATTPSRRPIIYSARFFEAAALGAMLDQFGRQAAGWSLADTPATRIAYLCILTAAAGLMVGVLYLARADRFTRFIPAPVFAGFSTSIAVILVVTQTQSLAAMLASGPRLMTLAIVAGTIATAFVIRLRMPRWPAAAIALAVGIALGLLSTALASAVPMLGNTGFSLTLPVQLADFRAFSAPDVDRAAMAWTVLLNAAILGSMVFVNTTLTSQVMTHLDGRPADQRPMLAWHAACMALGGALGSAPLSGGYQTSVAATRYARIGPLMLVVTAGVMAAVCFSGVLGWTPVAAVVGVLLCEAWFLVDRMSLRQMRRWLRREPLLANEREDLALVAAVTGTAVIVNMIAAVFVGWLLGLLLFAARSARRPVRAVWTGAHLSSNCARPRRDVDLLARSGERVRIVEFDRDLFFGAVDSLDRTLRAEMDRAASLILDWTAVRHVDSSAAQAVAKFEREAAARGVRVLHVDPTAQSQVQQALEPYIASRSVVASLDRALELAENELLAREIAVSAGDETTTHVEDASLLAGLSIERRRRLDAVMQQRTIARGGALVTAGQPADELLLVLKGTASVVLPQPGGAELRIAGVRHGATIGEMGFLDGSIRSASVIADEETIVLVLTRAEFDAIERDDPQLARQLVTNIALDVATRLRHSNRLALSRHGSRQAG